MATTYDKASLVMIPSGYKDDKLYSIKPTDGSGDFTFSRDGSGASPATRVNSDGNIEKGRTNYLLYSQDIADAYWNKGNMVATADQSIAPDGTLTADLIDDGTATGSHFIEENETTAGKVITASIHAKYVDTQYLVFSIYDTSYKVVIFDIQNGTIGSQSTSSLIPVIEDLGSGWYRCIITFPDCGRTDPFVAFGLRDDDVAAIYNGAGTNRQAYIWGVQLENGLISTSYIATTTTAVSAGLLGDMPRLDYSGGATCPSLLLEPSRTNAYDNSEYFDAWNSNRLDATANAIVSPEGVQNAYKLAQQSGFTTAPNVNITGFTANTYTASVFAKKGTWNYLAVSFNGVSYFNLNDGTKGTEHANHTSSIEDYGNGWYRCTITLTTTTTQTIAYYVAESDNTLTTPDTQGYAYLYGAQIEANASYPTSYIPTYGSASLRGADACSKTGLSSIIGQTEGTLFIDYTASHEGGNGERILAIGDGTASNRIVLFEASNKIRVYAADSGSLQWDYITTIDFEGTHKIAVTYAANSAAIYIDGTEIETDSSFVVPSCNNVYLGTSEAFGVSLGGTIKEAILFDSTLTDAECIALTTI